MQIKFDNVSYSYNLDTPLESAALRNVSISFEPGSFTALVGHTGSGKSTLAQHINGLLLPTKGKVFVGDFVLSENKKERTKDYKKIRKTVGLVFQFPEYQLFEETVEKDIAFGPKNFGFSNEEVNERVLKAIKYVGLDESFLKRSPFDLSGGEKRRVALAGILACKPDVLIVDEPSAGLDPLGVKSMMDLLSELSNRGISIIMISHDMEAVVRYAKYVVIMNKGEVVFKGPTNEVFKSDVSKYSLDTPQALLVARKLNENGYQIDLSKVTGLHSLVDEILRGKK